MLLLLAALSASGWQFDTVRDPLGQPVYVASIAPDAARPFVHLTYACGGIVGVELQFNLGEMPAVVSNDEPEFEHVRFGFAEGNYDTVARRAPITEGLGTFEIKGSEAHFVASLLKDSDGVQVSRNGAAVAFTLLGARIAIDEVMSACPFKYPDQ
jgi:hypothetical protein